jgi:hypothetical protein
VSIRTRDACLTFVDTDVIGKSVYKLTWHRLTGRGLYIVTRTNTDYGVSNQAISPLSLQETLFIMLPLNLIITIPSYLSV